MPLACEPWPSWAICRSRAMNSNWRHSKTGGQSHGPVSIEEFGVAAVWLFPLSIGVLPVVVIKP